MTQATSPPPPPQQTVPRLGCLSCSAVCRTVRGSVTSGRRGRLPIPVTADALGLGHFLATPCDGRPPGFCGAGRVRQGRARWSGVSLHVLHCRSYHMHRYSYIRRAAPHAVAPGAARSAAKFQRTGCTQNGTIGQLKSIASGSFERVRRDVAP